MMRTSVETHADEAFYGVCRRRIRRSPTA